MPSTLHKEVIGMHFLGPARFGTKMVTGPRSSLQFGTKGPQVQGAIWPGPPAIWEGVLGPPAIGPKICHKICPLYLGPKAFSELWYRK